MKGGITLVDRINKMYTVVYLVIPAESSDIQQVLMKPV